MHQYIFNLVCLLNFDADSYAIYTGLNEYPLVFVSGYRQRVEKNFWRTGGFDFGNVVPFRRLRGKIGESEGSSERGADTLKIRT